MGLSSGPNSAEKDSDFTPTAGESTFVIEKFTLPAFCSLCLSAPVVDPVLLHASSALSGGVSRSKAAAEVCVACKECVANWAPLLLAAGESGDCPQCSERVHRDGSAAAFPSLLDMSLPPSAKLKNPLTHLCRSEEDSLVEKPFVLMDAVTAWREKQTPASGKEEASAFDEMEAVCGVCEEKKGTVMCLQCGFALCTDCQAATHSKGRFKLHEVLPLAEAKRRAAMEQQSQASNAASQGGSTLRRSQRSCSLHASQSLDLYCRDCDKCICVTCCFGGDHKSHDVAPLADVAETSRNAVRGMTAQMGATANEAASTSANLRGLEPDYSATVASVEGQVRAAFAALQRALASREEELIAQLKASASGMHAGIAEQARLSDRITTALRTSEEKLSGFTAAAGDVTLMEALPAITEGHKKLQTVASRLSGEASRAQRKLVTRLSAPQRWGDGAAGALVSFRLFPREAAEGETNSVDAVAEYAQLLASLGQLTAQTVYPEPDTETPVAAEEEEQGSFPEKTSLFSGNATARMCLDTEDATSKGLTDRVAVLEPPLRKAESQQKKSSSQEEQVLVEGASSVAIAPRLPSKTTSASPLLGPEHASSLSSTSREVGSRRTEAHFFGKPTPPVTTITTMTTARSSAATAAAVDDWPMFSSTHGALPKMAGAGSAPSLSAPESSTSGRKRLLDISFDRSVGGDARNPNSDSGLARFSNAARFSNNDAQPCPTFEWGPATKVSRLDTTMEAFAGKSRLDMVSRSPEKEADVTEARSKTSSSFNLQLRI